MEATEYPLAQGGFPDALDPGEPILLLREGMDGDVCLCLQTLKQLHTVVVLLLHGKLLRWHRKAKQLQLLSCARLVLWQSIGTGTKGIWFPAVLS